MIYSARVKLSFGYICLNPLPKTPIVFPPSFNADLMWHLHRFQPPPANNHVIFSLQAVIESFLSASSPYEVGFRVPTTPRVFFLVKSFLSPLKKRTHGGSNICFSKKGYSSSKIVKQWIWLYSYCLSLSMEWSECKSLRKRLSLFEGIGSIFPIQRNSS